MNLKEKNRSKSLSNSNASYHSNVFALIGTVVLFALFPIFNSALNRGEAYDIAFINTVLAISASGFTAFLVSVIINGKFGVHEV